MKKILFDLRKHINDGQAPKLMSIEEVEQYLSSQNRPPDFSESFVHAVQIGAFQAYMASDGEMVFKVTPGLEENDLLALMMADYPAEA